MKEKYKHPSKLSFVLFVLTAEDFFGTRSLNSVQSFTPICTYIDYIADRRLEGVGLAPLNPGVDNPFPWLAEMMDIKKEQNFFEGRVTEYQKASSLEMVCDDDL